jgi:hypothetical protein
VDQLLYQLQQLLVEVEVDLLLLDQILIHQMVVVLVAME